MDEHRDMLINLLAVAIHEAGRPAVAAGETPTHAVDPTKVQPFVEWADLPQHVVRGRRMTAANLLHRRRGERYVPLAEETDFDKLARRLHAAERDAVEAGLVPLGPWSNFDDLPGVDKTERRRQAMALASRLSMWS